MPGSVVHDQDLTNPWLGRNRFGHLIEKELEHLGVDALDNEAEQAAAVRSDRSDDIGPDVLAQIRHGAPLARLHPAAARTRIAFDATLVSEPQFNGGILSQAA